MTIEFEPQPVLGQRIHGNILLYGPPKSGKTAAAASAPGPVLLITADTPNATRYAQLKYGEERLRVVRLKANPELPPQERGLQKLKEAAEYLNSDAGKDIETVVLDPVGEVYSRLLEDQANYALSPSLPTYGNVQTHLERMCRKLCERADVNFVIVAHEGTTDGQDGGDVEKLPNAGPSKDKLAQKMMGMVDIVAYTKVVEREDGTSLYAAQIINANGRRGGDRFDCLGKYRELNLTEWIDTASNHDPTKPAAPKATDETPAKGEKEKKN